MPDLILLDLMMAEMDGYQFCEQHGSDPRLGHIPIVVMTADGNIQSESMTPGNGLLRKPFSDVDAILATVEQFFK